MLGDVCLCFLCSRRNNPQSGAAAAAAHHFHPAPAAAWAWPVVKCHLSPSPVPYTGLHWPRLHKVVPVWRLCPLWAGEQGGGRAAVWAQPPPAQSRSLSDDEQQRAESIGKHLLSCQWMYQASVSLITKLNLCSIYNVLLLMDFLGDFKVFRKSENKKVINSLSLQS